MHSPHANARIRGIATSRPEATGRVFTAADLPRMKAIRVVTQAIGCALATTGHRSPPTRRAMSARPIAACIGATRAEAEDLAAMVTVDYETLDAVVDAPRDMRGGALVHEQWGDNLFMDRSIAAAVTSRPRQTRRRRHRRHPRIPDEPAIGSADGGARGARLP